jgi:hypothetical protein
VYRGSHRGARPHLAFETRTAAGWEHADKEPSSKYDSGEVSIIAHVPLQATSSLALRAAAFVREGRKGVSAAVRVGCGTSHALAVFATRTGLAIFSVPIFPIVVLVVTARNAVFPFARHGFNGAAVVFADAYLSFLSGVFHAIPAGIVLIIFDCNG